MGIVSEELACRLHMLSDGVVGILQAGEEVPMSVTSC